MGYWIAAAALVGGVISSEGEKSANEDNVAAREAAYGTAVKSIESLKNRAVSGNYYGYNLEDIFGSKVDPAAALYDPVNLTESQYQTIGGNITNFGQANTLAQMTNNATVQGDLTRIRNLSPSFDKNLSQYSGITSSLLAGQNPYGNEDVLGIVSDRSSLAASLGTPGGSGPATNKDLGLTRLALGQQGAGMFESFLKTADAISPINSQFRVQQSYMTPSERLAADIQQRESQQQTQLSAAYLDAAADPAAANLFNLDFSSQVGLGSAKLGSAVNLSNPYAGIANGISAAGAAYGNYQQNQQQQQRYNNQSYGYSGGTYTPASSGK